MEKEMKGHLRFFMLGIILGIVIIWLGLEILDRIDSIKENTDNIQAFLDDYSPCISNK